MAHEVGCLSSDILTIYHEADAQVARAADATGLQCPPGCGRCCHSPKIMASVLEVLPLALEIYQTGDQETIMAAIEKQGDHPTCVIFQADATDANKGRCARYAVRPLVCRLFGYTARQDKYGNLETALCKVLKQNDPHAAQRAQVGVKSGLMFPEFQAFFMQIASQQPHLGYRVLPINTALKEALEYLYWKWPLMPDSKRMAS